MIILIILKLLIKELLFRLGIILGTKIFVNFSKYPFEECMTKLLLEIDEQICDKKTKNQPIMNKNNSSEKKVQDWTNKVNF